MHIFLDTPLRVVPEATRMPTPVLALTHQTHDAVGSAFILFTQQTHPRTTDRLAHGQTKLAQATHA